MADKQIIDVIKCIHFNKSDIPNGCTCYWDGECNHDCYYKQLKRKEQECEELKSENFTFEELIKIQEEQLDDDNVIIERFLIASGKSKDITEPDEFEEVFQDIEQTYSEHEELKKECEELKKANEGILTTIRILAKNNSRLKEILSEIKDIAEANMRIADLEGLNGVYRRGLAKQILQKISEV